MSALGQGPRWGAAGPAGRPQCTRCAGGHERRPARPPIPRSRALPERGGSSGASWAAATGAPQRGGIGEALRWGWHRCVLVDAPTGDVSCGLGRGRRPAAVGVRHPRGGGLSAVCMQGAEPLVRIYKLPVHPCTGEYLYGGALAVWIAGLTCRRPPGGGCGGRVRRRFSGVTRVPTLHRRGVFGQSSLTWPFGATVTGRLSFCARGVPQASARTVGRGAATVDRQRGL